jgi:hypothetical protein
MVGLFCLLDKFRYLMRIHSAVVIVVALSSTGCGQGKDQPLSKIQEPLKRIETGTEEMVEKEEAGRGHHEFSLTNQHNKIRAPGHDEEARHSDGSSSSSETSASTDEHKESFWDRVTGKHKKEQKSLNSDDHSSEGVDKKKKSSWGLFSRSSSSEDTGHDSASSENHSESSKGSSGWFSSFRSSKKVDKPQ